MIGIESNASILPFSAELHQNYPNPFNPNTKITYDLSITSYIDLDIHDISGRLVKKLVNEKQSAGSYQVEFSSGGLPSGVYFYSLAVDGVVIGVKKMLTLK
jgi:hypothetical protein